MIFASISYGYNICNTLIVYHYHSFYIKFVFYYNDKLFLVAYSLPKWTHGFLCYSMSYKPLLTYLFWSLNCPRFGQWELLQRNVLKSKFNMLCRKVQNEIQGRMASAFPRAFLHAWTRTWAEVAKDRADVRRQGQGPSYCTDLTGIESFF